MNLQQIRWPVVIVALALTLGVLFGAGWLLKSQTVDQPLQQLMAREPQVAASSLLREGDEMIIQVSLKQSIDLQTTYAQLNQDIRKIMGSAAYRIKVQDQRTPALEQAVRRIDLYVQEAMATGQFATMADRVEAEAQKLGATATVGVDSDRVYVTVELGDHYLYHVVERQPVRTAANQGGGGSQ